MKHILLGTTALITAGLMAGPAASQEGIRLGLGGFYYGAAGGNIDEDLGDDVPDKNDWDFKQSVEVHFLGDATLDNGLTVGARVELEAQEQADEIDEVYAYFSGGFGELRFGDDDDAYAHLCYLVPTASAAFGADSPFLNFSNAGAAGYNGTNGTCYGLSGDSTKLIYFTPSFGGFQLAASFAPDNLENTGDNFTGTADEDRDGGVNNIVSGAATYAADLNGISLAVGGGASMGDRDDTAGAFAGNDDPEFYNAYAQFGLAGWTIGAATEFRDNVFVDDGSAWVYGLGATYGFEAWTVGLGWTRGEYELDGDDEDKYDIIQFTAAYALGPGITVDAEVGWNDYNADVATSEDYESIEAAVGFGISF